MKTFNCNSHKILSPWQLMSEKYLIVNIEINHFRHTKFLLKKCIIKIIMTLTLMAIFELPIHFVVWVRICCKSVKHECHPVLIYTTWCCPKLLSNGRKMYLWKCNCKNLDLWNFLKGAHSSLWGEDPLELQNLPAIQNYLSNSLETIEYAYKFP